MISCVEEFRAELAGFDLLALAADPDVDDLQAAKTAFGLEVRAEPDGEPHCDWCGRSDPPGGLADESLGGPEVHACVDGDDCAETRTQREPMWLDKQFKFWKIDWDKYRRIQQYQAEQAARSRWGGGIYALTPDEEPDPEFTAALEQVRLAVEHRLDDYAAAAEVTLAAPVPDPAEPAPVNKFDPWGHTLRHPRHHQHLLGHHRQHPHVHDAASALGRKAVLARG